MKKLYALFAGVMGMAFCAQAEVIEGVNFDFTQGTPVTVGICTYDYDMEKNGTQYYGMVEVPGWTADNPTGNAHAGGLFEYGSDAWLGGKGYNVPAEGPEGEAGNCVGLIGVWTGTAQYTQEVELPAGEYTITMPIYCAGKSEAPQKGLFGFIAEDGTEYLAPTTAYTQDQWTTETIEFTLEEATKGVISMGFTAKNIGSGSNMHLFVDHVYVANNNVKEPQNLSELFGYYTVTVFQGEINEGEGFEFFQEPGFKVEISAFEEEDWVVLTGFFGDDFFVAGEVDMAAGTITFPEQSIWSNDEEYTFCAENGGQVVAKFDENFKVTFNGWTLMTIADEEPVLKSIECTFVKGEAEPVQNISELLGYYTATVFQGEINEGEGFEFFQEPGFKVEISAFEEENWVVFTGFFSDEFAVAGKVDMAAGTITLPEQTVWTNDVEYTFCAENGGDVVAKFDENFKVIFNGWTLMVDDEPFLKSIECTLVKGDAEPVQNISELLATYTVNTFAGEINEGEGFEEFSEPGFQVELSAFEEENWVVLTGFFSDEFAIAGKVDMAAGTITFPEQTVYSNDQEYTFCAEDGGEVVATFDDVYTVTFNGWTLMIGDEPFLKNITCTFTKGASSIKAVEAANNGVVEYYSLQGVKLANPAQGQIVIRVADGKAQKVLVK